jgi:hypothetical protein
VFVCQLEHAADLPRSDLRGIDNGLPIHGRIGTITVAPQPFQLKLKRSLCHGDKRIVGFWNLRLREPGERVGLGDTGYGVDQGG